MIVCEIGLNHLGDPNYGEEYIEKIIESKSDGITFQIRENDYYSKKEHSHLLLSDSFYQKISEKIHDAGLKFGIAIAEESKIDFFNSINVDFYKILSWDLNNFSLIDKLCNTGKPIFVSTGMGSLDEISKFVQHVSSSKNQFSLIHTQLSHSLDEVNLKAIATLKTKFDLPVSYGNHALNMNTIYASIGFEPSDIFLYVKGNHDIKHPDDEHALNLNDLPELILNIHELYVALGTGKKQKMDKKIK